VTPPRADKRDMERFARLTFEDFRKMAVDDSLTRTQKIGFPDTYRDGADEAILADIVSKLPALEGRQNRVLDIGPGCGMLALMMLDLCAAHGHEVVLVDSAEMLAQLPDRDGVTKVPGAFPASATLSDDAGGFDAIVAYSVLHYVFAEADPFAFLDRATELLAHGGRLLIGDVPNVSKRRRFFSSPAGIAFHKRFMETDDPPEVDWQTSDPGQIDDDAVLALLARARAARYDAYVLPLRDDLPLANRREDILVVRP
jgi:2-polyprenyl-3-methyl-5-hydroxy-6-metoxy-1,4-benzoquinol methylase